VAVLNPINTPAKWREFSVIDLEWVPGETLPLPKNTTVEVEGMRGTFTIPLPVSKRQTEPLKLRLAAVYDEVEDEAFEHAEGDEPVKVERYESFKTVAELLDTILVRENRGRWFYAHAGGLADMEFVLDEILKEIKENLIDDAGTRYTLRLADGSQKEMGIERHEDYGDSDFRIRASFSGSSAIIVHVSKGKNSWHFCDSYWLLRDKLSSIGKAIKIKKGDTPQAVAFLQKRFGKDNLDSLAESELKAFFTDAPIDVLTAYNKVDCMILWKAIAQFEEEIQSLGGQLQQTIASTGMSLFRRQYLKQTIYTSEKVNQISEDSYFSSRVEDISRNCSDFLMYDINSSFPFSMTFPQPAGLTEIRASIPDGWLDMAPGIVDPDDPRERNIFIADVTIEVGDMVLPPIPYRMDNRVFFPIGRWRSWLTSTDIKLALREGCTLHKVHEVYVFEPFMDLRGYATDIYAKRAAASDPFRRLVLKYLLNSLYGKYAENPLKQEMLLNPDEIDRDKMQLLQPGVWLREKAVPIAHRHVPISTHITAIARRTLYEYMKECYRQGLPVYYCDTDSIATRAKLPVDEKKLGMLKLEKKLEWAEFIAPKIYRGEGFELAQESGQWVEKEKIQMAKAKGFSLGKHKSEAWERFAKIAAGDRIGIQRQVRLRELYRSGLTAPIDILVIKALTFEMLSKRFHYPDGETRPWSIKELHSGSFYPKGFDFEPEFYESLDTTTRAMLEAAV
jgi:hypothetical protein